MWADPDADYDKVGALQAELEDKIAAADAWSLERNVEIAMDALRCPPDDADVTKLSGGERRRVAPVPTAAQPPRPAAARRAHQPPRRRERRLARALLAGVRGHRRGHHPRPLLPRQRRQVDPRARPRPRHPVRGQLLQLARAEAGAPGQGGEGQRRQARRTLERELEWVRMSPKARQAKGKARLAAYDKLQAEAEAAERGPDKLEITIPAGQAPGRHGHRGARPAQGLRRPAARSRTCRSRSPAPASSASSAPTAPARPPCSRCSPARSRPTRARSRSATRSSWPTSTRAATRSTPTPPCYEEITGGVEHMKVGNREIHGRAYCASFNFKGSRPAEARRRPVGRRAQPCAPGQGAEDRRQRAAARRAHQRPRCRHPARARRRRSTTSPAARW